MANKLKSMETDGINTSREIAHQPSLWQQIWKKVESEKEKIQEFFEIVNKDCDSIILTGAGTSAYIGISAQRAFRKTKNIICEPISTTHIVSHPKDFFIPNQSVLMISFARSGNSPESCAAVNLANQCSRNVKHFIITCNKDGNLAQDNLDSKDAYVFVLPEEANDKSLAMTSSFTGMLLASILIARIDEIDKLEKEVDKLAAYGKFCLSQEDLLKDIAGRNFKRAIFLGSGPLYGIAKEAQLKLQELTDGMVICKHDSFLGLRHGPKAVIDEDTLIVHFLSSDAYANKYEMDLIKSMKESSNPLGQLAIGENFFSLEYVDWSINFESFDMVLDEDLLSIACIVPAQMLALYKSFQLGLTPDNPSRNGAISRVVEGVSIYNT